MAKWNEHDQTLTLNQDDRVDINVEGIGAFIQVISHREGKDNAQTLEIYEDINDELIYVNDFDQPEA